MICKIRSGASGPKENENKLYAVAKAKCGVIKHIQPLLGWGKNLLVIKAIHYEALQASLRDNVCP